MSRRWQANIGKIEMEGSYVPRCSHQWGLQLRPGASPFCLMLQSA